jgi:hypothetical protein
MDDFGIDDELPQNPLVFVLEAGTHHKYFGRLLVFAPNGVPEEGKRFLIHNAKGVYHNLQISRTGLLRLGDRRRDAEAHNVHPPNRWSEPPTPIEFNSITNQYLAEQDARAAEHQEVDDSQENLLPRIDTPIVSDPSTPTTVADDNSVIRLHPIPDYIRTSPITSTPLPTMSNTQTQNVLTNVNYAGLPCTPGGTPI